MNNHFKYKIINLSHQSHFASSDFLLLDFFMTLKLYTYENTTNYDRPRTNYNNITIK